MPDLNKYISYKALLRKLEWNSSLNKWVLTDNNLELLSESAIEAENSENQDYGEWIDSSVPGSVLAECSLCHYDCGAYSMKFCPNCGKPMKGGAKDAENDAD